MKRGNLVTVAVAGDFGKARPALIIQSDLFAETATLTVLLITSTLIDTPLVRLSVAPTSHNGLREPSQIMVDKAITVRREKVGPVIGTLADDEMIAVDRSLALFMGLA
jgi:mRNA interferase MazF